MSLILPATGMLYFHTGNTGGSLDITGPEGVAQIRRVDPHGVVMLFADHRLSIGRDSLPTIARYFAAAAAVLDVDINDGWDDGLPGRGFPSVY